MLQASLIDKSRMRREFHVRFCERLRVKIPRSTRPPMENFFHTLKTEFVYFSDFKTRVEAKTSVFWWVCGFYNRKRIHSSLGYKTPIDYEREFMLKAA